uniref:Uncharacterized protein n=1 Tax=Panagrolaimus sp. PS1159 TaxID=55785 RepID=A0AC35GFE3_9BILA
MESSIGALGSPDDVFNQRYHDFFDNLLPDSSSLAFSILASYVNRLTPEMFRTIQQKIQTKLVDASRLESSEGIVFFAWTVLKKHPKILTYNQGAYRAITWKALEFAFIQRFVKDDAVEDDSIFEVPFALFSTIYGNEWKLITGSITVVSKKKPPYKQDSIMDIPILNEYGNSKKHELLYFLWALLENVIVNSFKGFKINVEYVLKVLEISLSLRHQKVTEKAFGTIITIARAIKTNFAIYIDRILFILQTSTIPSNIVYKFLINLLEELGPLADISKLYTTAVFKFANVTDKSGSEDASQHLEIIGRQEFSNEILNNLRDDENDGEENFDSLYDLVICILETIPTFVPVPYIKRIQMGICKRLLQSQTPSTKDLQLLNALLAIRNERVPSPIQIARVVYSWSSVYKTPELAPYIKIGKALCDTQRSVRMNTFELFEVGEIQNVNETTEDVPKIVAQLQKITPLPSESVVKVSPSKPQTESIGEDVSSKTTSDLLQEVVQSKPQSETVVEAEPQSEPVVEVEPQSEPVEQAKEDIQQEKIPSEASTVSTESPEKNPSRNSNGNENRNPVIGQPIVTLPKVAASSSGSTISVIPKPGNVTSRVLDDDSDDDCMIINEITPVKTSKPLTSTPAAGSRKRNNAATEESRPSKKMNNDKPKRPQMTVPEMLTDLFSN